MPLVEVREELLGQLGFLPLRAIPRLRLFTHAVETPVDVLAVGDDQLEAERLEVGAGIGFLGETVEHREERISLAKLAGDLRAAGHVDDPDRGRCRLPRAHDLSKPAESVVCDHRHPEVRLLSHVRIRRDLCARVSQRVVERRLPGVGKADDADPERHGELRVEADASLARVALRVEHPGEDQQEHAVLRLQLDRRDGSGSKGGVEQVGARSRHERAQDLTTVEADLDPYEIVSHSQPPP